MLSLKAAVKASVSKPDEALPALTRALELSTQRFRADPKARDLIAQARADPRFNALRDYTNFQLLVR